MLSLTDIDRFIAETWNVMLSRERSWLVTFDHQLVVVLVVLVSLPISNVMEKKIKDEFSMMMSQAYLVRKSNIHYSLIFSVISLRKGSPSPTSLGRGLLTLVFFTSKIPSIPRNKFKSLSKQNKF